MTKVKIHKPRRAFYKKINKQDGSYQLGWALFNNAVGWIQIRKEELLSLMNDEHKVKELEFDPITYEFLPTGICLEDY